ncbi:type II/IV secretion system protein [Candidatus Peregrinibacteria bacterium]|nr:type II/IV secretion system protein [Candidatus Peregrinibacteria bacterium]
MTEPFHRNIKGINQAFKERDIQRMAKEKKLPYVNLATIPLNPDFVSFLEEARARFASVAVFLKSGKKLKLAATDPDLPATKALVESLQTQGYEISIHLASQESLDSAYRVYTRVITPTKEETTAIKEVGSFAEEIQTLELLKKKVENSPSDIALHTIAVGAYRTRSSDIHFQPEQEEVLVRFRIDGVLQHVFDLPRKVYEGILTQIKYMAHMKANIVEVPQDGQYAFTAEGKLMNVRTSTLPTQYGEACVLRLLDSERTFSDFRELGYRGQAIQDIEAAVGLSHGMILITGPTGSGKTTTLYSMLKKIDVNVKKVITLEDPIEYRLAGISQSQVDPDRKFDFATGLCSILRQDPDVIMVGEIRDLETAETAAQASLTGHLVISTLHTNSSVEAIPRLVNMGVRSFILAPALKLIVAQRLVRKLCPACMTTSPLTSSEIAFFEPAIAQMNSKGMKTVMPSSFKRAKGCLQCSQTGYLGQTAIAEALRFDDSLRDMILENRSMPEIYRYVHEDVKMATVQEDGLLKVLEGITTLEEVIRVTA